MTSATKLHTHPGQLSFLGSKPSSNGASNSTVFVNNMVLPVHGWFRFSAGFSAQWAEALIREHQEQGPVRVLDPFAGSGTANVSAQCAGAESIGVEAHPFYGRLAQAKVAWSAIDPIELRRRARLVLDTARPVRHNAAVPSLLEKCYTPETLAELLGIRETVEAGGSGMPVDELLWLALVAILRSCSFVGTAQWQYVLPQKRKARVAEPRQAFRDQIDRMARDIELLTESLETKQSRICIEDARCCASVPDEWATLVVTSPPYPNNYDYADAARLEMTFLGEVSSWGDLKKVRSHLVRSCSQHMTGYDMEPALASKELAPIRKELLPVVQDLGEVKQQRGGRKAYDQMVVAYFRDLAATWHALRRGTARGATVCFVVGDSAPYGVHVPVERWLGELALSAGFVSWRFEKLRDRNIKWKNRKHRVPLQEGRLWVEA